MGKWTASKWHDSSHSVNFSGYWVDDFHSISVFLVLFCLSFIVVSFVRVHEIAVHDALEVPLLQRVTTGVGKGVCGLVISCFKCDSR